MKKTTVLGSTLCKRILAIMLCVCMLVMACGCDSIDYKKATKLYNNGEWDEAIEIFESLGSYEDSKEMVNACNYEKATELYENKDYDEAIEIFTELSDYEDSENMIANCKRRKIEPYLISNYTSLSDNNVEILFQYLDYSISEFFYDEYNSAKLAMCSMLIESYDGLSFIDTNAYDFDKFYIAICQEDNRVDIYFPNGDNIILGMQFWPDDYKAQIGNIKTSYDIVAYLDLLVEGGIIDDYDHIPKGDLNTVAGIIVDNFSD